MERPPTSTHWHPWSGVVRTDSTRRVCLWSIELSDGCMSWGFSHFGTAEGAKRKAERLIAKWTAAERARRERAFEVGP